MMDSYRGFPDRRRRRPSWVALALGVAVAALPVAGAPAPADASAPSSTAATCTWQPSALPNLPDATGGEVRGTDGDARYSGVSYAEAGANHAVLWTRRHATDLGVGIGLDVNRSGVVVGADADGPTTGHARMWRGTQAIVLAEPTGVSNSQAVAVNDSGLIVGQGWGVVGTVGLVWTVRNPRHARILTARHEGAALLLRAVTEERLIVGDEIQSPGLQTSAVAGTVRNGLHDLATPAPGQDYATQAAAGRYIVGSYLWRDGRPQPLPASHPGFAAIAVNRFGLVGGIDYGTFGPMLWWGPAVTLLTIPAGGSGGAVHAVTDHLEVAGSVGGVGPTTWTCRR